MCIKGHEKYHMFRGFSLFLSGLKYLILCPFRYLDKCSEGDGLNNLRSCLHDTGMTFIPERVHSISIYRKIPKISPGAYIFQRPFLRRLFLEGLIFAGAYLQREICVSKSIGLAL